MRILILSLLFVLAKGDMGKMPQRNGRGPIISSQRNIIKKGLESPENATTFGTTTTDYPASTAIDGDSTQMGYTSTNDIPTAIANDYGVTNENAYASTLQTDYGTTQQQIINDYGTTPEQVINDYGNTLQQQVINDYGGQGQETTQQITPELQEIIMNSGSILGDMTGAIHEYIGNNQGQNLGGISQLGSNCGGQYNCQQQQKQQQQYNIGQQQIGSSGLNLGSISSPGCAGQAQSLCQPSVQTANPIFIDEPPIRILHQRVEVPIKKTVRVPYPQPYRVAINIPEPIAEPQPVPIPIIKKRRQRHRRVRTRTHELVIRQNYVMAEPEPRPEGISGSRHMIRGMRRGGGHGGIVMGGGMKGGGGGGGGIQMKGIQMQGMQGMGMQQGMGMKGGMGMQQDFGLGGLQGTERLYAMNQVFGKRKGFIMNAALGGFEDDQGKQGGSFGGGNFGGGNFGGGSFGGDDYR